jgi:hypothetical protein
MSLSTSPLVVAAGVPTLIPFDTRSPFVTSGMRVGTPAATTRGLVESDMEQLVAWMDEAIINHNDDTALEKIGSAVMAHTNKYPQTQSDTNTSALSWASCQTSLSRASPRW